jgi:DNA primase large subunit
MQKATTRFTKTDLAKYPFLKETTEHVKKLDLRIEDLTNPEYNQILERAKERVEEAILFIAIDRRLDNPEVEISSFPTAIMLATATKNSFIQKRYALAEAKQTYEDLLEEPKERILEIAKNFQWKLALNNKPEIPLDFALNFTNYLRNITHLKDKKWKLVNRILTDGTVYLSRNETARLLSEEVRKHIEKRLETKEQPTFPQKIADIAEQIKQLSLEKIGKAEMEGFPKIVLETAFPPCINSLYQSFTSGRHLSHIGRFTLTTFLINIGMPTDKLIELYRNLSDFNERMTRYQVEHLAGEKGSRTKYIPPKCETLRTHGVCTNPDNICQGIRHPLSYYRIKLRISKVTP